MTVYENFKPLTPQQQRLYKNRVMLSNLPKAQNNAVTLPDVLLLPATADDPGNQLKAGDQNADLRVFVGKFPDATSPDREIVSVQLYWDGSPLGDAQTFETPLANPDAKFPMEFIVPQKNLRDSGPHQINYLQKFGENSEFAADLEINIDNIAPKPAGQVIVPQEVKDEGAITKSYLDTHGFVHLEIPEYAGGAKIGDVGEFRYGPAIAVSRLVERVERLDVSMPIETSKLTKDFIGNEEGEQSLFYRLYDRKDNVDGYSDFLVLGVVLSDPPLNVLLDVGLHDDDKLITVEDGQTPVTGVLTYDNWLRGDRLVMSVDGQAPINVEVSNTPPFVADLSYKYLQNGNDGLKVSRLVYQIKRGAYLYPKTAISKDLNIDFRAPVPIDPENPGLPGGPHPDLDPVTVQGSVTTEANKIRVVDLVAEVDAFVPIYTGHAAGHVVTLHWQGVDVPADPVKGKGGVYTLDGSEDDTTVLRFTIKPEFIRLGGNDIDLLAHYNVEHTVNENFNRSLNREVDVHVVDAVIPKPVFQHTVDGIDGPTLYCSAIRRDTLNNPVIEVEIPGGELQLANQDLKFVYQGYSIAADNCPGPVIPGNTVTVNKKPTPDEAQDGFIVQIPYHQFSVTNNGWGEITYQAQLDGQPATGESDKTKVTMRIGGATCPI